MAREKQPLSKLLRGLAQADTSIVLHLKHLDRRLARLIYSAIPNKTITILTLYTQQSPPTKLTPDELEAIHLFSRNSNLYSKALELEIKLRQPCRICNHGSKSLYFIFWIPLVI